MFVGNLKQYEAKNYLLQLMLIRQKVYKFLDHSRWS